MTLAWQVELSHADKLVLLALADNANDEGHCFPSVTTLASKCCMHRATILRALDALEQQGQISREHRSGRSTVYHVHPSQKATSRRERPVAHGDPTRRTERPEPVAACDPTRRSVRPITVIEPLREPSREPQEARDRFHEVMAAYPKTANNTDWILTERICRRLVDDGESWDALIASAKRYAAQCEATQRTGTQYVTAAHKHFDGGKWRGEFPIPPSKAQKQQDGNVAAVQEWISGRK